VPPRSVNGVPAAAVDLRLTSPYRWVLTLDGLSIRVYCGGLREQHDTSGARPAASAEPRRAHVPLSVLGVELLSDAEEARSMRVVDDLLLIGTSAGRLWAVPMPQCW
jgi:uncharacterized protein YbjT (DUF2867 family)